jgi:predicted RNA-binding protein with RPS1 domain
VGSVIQDLRGVVVMAGTESTAGSGLETSTPAVAVNDIGSEEAFLAAIDETIKYFNDGDLVEGTVVKVDRDEILLDIGYKTEGVIPSRELSIKHDVDPHEVVKIGEHIEALVLQKEDKEGRLILSKKRAQYERALDALEEIKDEDGVVTGTVIEVVKGGLILDIGLRGFLPASLVEMRRVRDLQPYVGKEIEAKIIELDRNRNNVVLSRRAWLEQTQPAVQRTFLNTLREGQIRKGTVSSIVNFGAFIDLGVMNGLVHVSELSWKHIGHPGEIVQVGEEIFVKIIDVDLDRRRISLSLKQANESAISDQFDPTLYGMPTAYDDRGNYIYPEGFDPETAEWLPGHEAQREEWDRQYAEARTRFEAHCRQIEKFRTKAEEDGGAPGSLRDALAEVDAESLLLDGGALDAAADLMGYGPENLVSGHSEPGILPVTIYLSEAAIHNQVQSAVEALLASAGLRIESRDDPILGSWFRRMKAALAEAWRSPAGREAGLVAMHVADTRLVLAQDAWITSTLMQNLAPVIESLQQAENAVVRLGAVLIVKVNWHVTVLQLTAAQQATLDHQPSLAADPYQILTALNAAHQDGAVSASSVRFPGDIA